MSMCDGVGYPNGKYPVGGLIRTFPKSILENAQIL